MLSNKLFSSIGNTDRLYVDDVFSAYTYTGNDSTQTINNGIDLAGKGGLVWLKNRLESETHMLVNTARGAGFSLNSSSTAAEDAWGVSSFTSTGFSTTVRNESAKSYISWTFRRAPRFFDVVTYTGNGTSSRAIAHSLGQEVGMVMTKATSTTGDWNTYHRSATGDLVLNTTAAQTGSKALVNSATTSTFTVSGAANTTAETYVAYLFAHDATADGIIQCGSFSHTSGTPTDVTLGYEPQFILTKMVSTDGYSWEMCDVSRGMHLNGVQVLLADSSGAESTETRTNAIQPTATGFSFGGWYGTGTYIYLAIRRPNKPPTTGTQVYNATVSSITGVTQTVGFPTDMVIHSTRDSSYARIFQDRLRGGVAYLTYNSSAAEELYSSNASLFDQQNLFTSKYFNPGQAVNEIYHFFRRASGFFDVVCRSGTGTSAFTRVDVNHSLGAVPELIIYKCRSNTSGWIVGTFNPSSPTLNGYGQLSQTYAIDSTSFPGSFLYAAPTATQFSFWDGNSMGLNTSGRTYVAYLFASLPGISKVGSYTGNGSSQTINCGFSTGARFILLKRTDSTGDWYVWDTARGIIAANDPHLSLNTTAAEVTTNDSVDPNSTGFIVNQVAATNINVTSSTYLYLAIA